MLSAQKSIDKELQDIAEKIQAELPEELAAATHFQVDDKGECLVLDFAFKLDKTDYPLLIGIVKKYGGEFANKKVQGEDSPYFVVPKPKLSAAAEQSPAPSISPKDTSPKVSDKIKQPSPITQFTNNYCSVCADSGDKCNTTTTSGREYRAHCLETLTIQALQVLPAVLEKLCKLTECLHFYVVLCLKLISPIKP